MQRHIQKKGVGTNWCVSINFNTVKFQPAVCTELDGLPMDRWPHLEVHDLVAQTQTDDNRYDVPRKNQQETACPEHCAHSTEHILTLLLQLHRPRWLCLPCTDKLPQSSAETCYLSGLLKGLSRNHGPISHVSKVGPDAMSKAVCTTLCSCTRYTLSEPSQCPLSHTMRILTGTQPFQVRLRHTLQPQQHMLYSIFWREKGIRSRRLPLMHAASRYRVPRASVIIRIVQTALVEAYPADGCSPFWGGTAEAPHP